MVEAVVEFDYVAQESDELTLHKGDIITNIKTQPGGWWEGTLGGKRGMFPDNFVKVVTDGDTTKASDDVLRPNSKRRCKVLFSYQPANEDELRLEVDDLIDILEEVEEGWWKGKLGDTVGVFPSNFVTEIVDTRVAGSRKARTSSREEASESDGEVSTSMSSPDSSQVLDSVGKEPEADAPLLPPKPVKEICRALFPYEAANEDELTLKEGDLITIITKEVADKGWWRGELRGRVGVFPDNFVEVLPIEETLPKKPERPPAKSQLLTTNRARDSITKPSSGSSTGSSAVKPDGGHHHKLPDASVRSDEKTVTGPVPPLPGKKPTLPPPPIKKPHRSASASVLPTTAAMSIPPQQSKRETALESRIPTDAIDGAVSSRSAQHKSPQGILEFDSVERNAMLTHPTASRVKAPRRRPPSTVYSKEVDVLNTGMMNGSADNGRISAENHIAEEDVDEDASEKSRSRAWERGKAPWVEELKLNQAKKTSGLSPTAPTVSHSPPEQTDKKQIRLKHEPSPEPKQQTPSGVTMRVHASRPQSMFQESSTTRPRPLSAASPPDPARLLAEMGQARIKPLASTSPILAGLQVKQESTKPSNSTSSSTSPVLSNLLAKPADSTSPSSMSDPDLLASPTPRSPGLSSGSSVSYKQFTELKEKVIKLEHTVELQKEMFSKAITELTSKLNEETEKRLQLQQALDRLTNLVTQV